MLRTQERNSVAVLYQVGNLGTTVKHSCAQGPGLGVAPAVESSTQPCLGKLCKAGKTGLAKSSSSFQVQYCYVLLHYILGDY